MKRILSLFIVLVLMLSTLAACELPFFGSNTPKEVDIQKAVDQLHKMYGGSKEGTSVSAKDTFISGLEIYAEDDSLTEFTVVWSTNNENIKVNYVEADQVYVVVIPENVNEVIDFKLIATVKSAGGQERTVEFSRKLAPTTYGVIANPVAGTAYKFALLHGNERAVVYFDGNNYNGYDWYLEYSSDLLAAADVYLEAVEGVEGGYRLYFYRDEVKTYIRAFPRDNDTTKGTLGLTTETPEEYYTFNAEYKTLIYTSVTGEQFYIGSSGTYKSISLSAISYIDGATSYVAHLYGPGGEVEVLPEQELPTIPENYTSKDVVEALYKLQPGQTIEDSYYITGVITSIKYAYDPAYQNISVNIVVDGMTDKPVLCYRLSSMLDPNLEVGDTIKVYAGLTNYNGTYETTSGGQIIEHIKGTGTVPTPPVGGDDDVIVLDMMGSTNIQSHSNEQMVYAANGIILTNNKNTSTTNCYNNTGSYAARFYGGATIKIEYPGMTKIVLTLDDYSPEAGKDYLKGFDGMVVAGATITRDNDVVTIIFDTATDVFQSAALGSQIRVEKIEVYTGEVENGGNNGGDAPVVTPNYTAPVAGQPYDLFMELPTGKVYFNGSLDAEKSSYLDTTADAAASVKIYFEEVTGGYHIFFMNGDVKTYINAEAYLKSNGYAGCHFVFGETATCVWTYNTELGILEVYGEISGKSDTFFAGTYGSYSTVSLSGAYYKDQIATGTQFPARIEVAEGGEVIPPSQGGEETHTHTFVDGKCACGEEDPNYVPPSAGGDDEDDGVWTIPEVLASASGTSVVISGTVSEIYQSWSDQYNNISFYISDDAGNKLLVYRTGTNVVVGDKVTVTGTTTLYSNVIQIAQGATTVIDEKHVCSEYTEGSCTIDSVCVVCGAVGTAGDGHNYVDGVCADCGEVEPTGDVLPGNLVFTNLANKASADDYLKTNFPEWKITGKLGQGYAGYLGFGRSGDTKSAITSSAISTSSEFTVVTVLKGNGSSGVATSTLTFTLVDADGNTIATGYAEGSTTAAVTPADAVDTTYTISFTFEEGKTWSDVSNLVVTFAKATGNIGLKSLEFVK